MLQSHKAVSLCSVKLLVVAILGLSMWGAILECAHYVLKSVYEAFGPFWLWLSPLAMRH